MAPLGTELGGSARTVCEPLPRVTNYEIVAFLIKVYFLHYRNDVRSYLKYVYEIQYFIHEKITNTSTYNRRSSVTRFKTFVRPRYTVR